jgi:nitrogen fixation protein FixH
MNHQDQSSLTPVARNPRNFWPVAIVTFFGVAVLGCVGFVLYCSRQPVELVSADYYEQEMRFQKRYDSTARAQHLAAPASVSYEASAQRITVQLPPGQGPQAVSGSIELYRPSDSGLDRTVSLQVDSSGTQHVDAAALRPGLWKVRVSWTVDNQSYFTDQKVVIGVKAS